MVRKKARAKARAAPENSDEIKPWPEKVMGRKYVRMLSKYAQQLRDEDAAESHGNRELYLNDVFVVFLISFFTPSVRSLRTIEDFSQTTQAQAHISIPKICKSTLSDFNKLADPERLEPIMHVLRHEVEKQHGKSKNKSNDELPAELLEHLVAVDGTFVPAVSEVTWAIKNCNNHGGQRRRARLDAHVNVGSFVPEAIVVPELGQSEADCAISAISDGRIYLYDRGYMSFALLRAHYEEKEEGKLTKRAQFVSRFIPEGSNSPKLCVAEELPLTEKDIAAGVISDRIGYFKSDNAERAKVSSIKFREVVVNFEQDGETKTLRLITNLSDASATNIDVSATTIAVLYRQRWQVELFFRWLKSYANFSHLICNGREGVQFHLHVAIIGIMLMYLHTGYRPSKYTMVMLELVATGGATIEEILPILRERERQSDLAKKSAKARAEKNKQTQAK
jgi:hypothetical protein